MNKHMPREADSASAGKSKYFIPVVIVVLLIVALAVFKGLSKKQPSQTSSPAGSSGEVMTQIPSLQQVDPNSPDAAIQASTLSGGELTTALPAGFPKEDGSQILQNVKLNDTKTGQTKILVTVTTAKSLADSLALYKSYLSSHGWKIIKTTDIASAKALSVDKGTSHLDITFSYDGGSKSNVVATVYSTPGK